MSLADILPQLQACVRKSLAEHRDDIWKRWANGESQSSIARDYGVSQARISQLITKWKRSIRPRSA